MATHPIFFLFVPEGSFDQEVVEKRGHVGFAEFGGGIQDPEPVGGHGVEAGGVGFLQITQKTLQKLKLPLKFVSEAKENHGGVISICLDYTASFLPNPGNSLFISCSVQFAGPEREFRLEIDALLICCGEAGFGRAVGVEAHMIQAPLLEDFENSPPSLHVHRGVTGQWEGAPFVGSAEKDGEIVQGDAHPRAGNLSKSKRKLPCVLAVIRL